MRRATQVAGVGNTKFRHGDENMLLTPLLHRDIWFFDEIMSWRRCRRELATVLSIHNLRWRNSELTTAATHASSLRSLLK